jgi:serine/threonine protein kinase
VCVLGHLRAQSIAYRNLKPENVMLDANVSKYGYFGELHASHVGCSISHAVQGFISCFRVT